MADDSWSFADSRPAVTVAEELRQLAVKYGCPPNMRPIDWVRSTLEDLLESDNEQD